MTIRPRLLEGERTPAAPQYPAQTTAAPPLPQIRQVPPAMVLQRALATAPHALRPADVLTLQRTMGNNAVQRLLAARRVPPSAAPTAKPVRRVPAGAAVVQRALATIGTGKLTGSRAGKPVLKGRRTTGAGAAFAAKTKVAFETATFPHPLNEQVGVKMEGIIGPDHPAGSAPQPSAHPKAINYLTITYAQKFIRGHLLNGDLGGPGYAENLYPITAQANSHHYQYVEQQVKAWINDKHAYVYYKVEVDRTPGGMPGNDPLDADFACTAYPIDPLNATTNPPGQALGSEKIDKRIASRAGGVSGTTDMQQSYKLGGAALVEPAANVGLIELQAGKLPIGYTAISGIQIGKLQTIERYINDHAAHTEPLEAILQQELGIGTASFDLVYAVMDSGEIPEDMSKARWNALANKVNSADLDDISTQMTDFINARPRKSQRGRKYTPVTNRFNPYRR